MVTLIYSLLRRDSDHLSTWQGSIGSNLPSCPSTHIEPVISGGLGAVAFIHVLSRVIVGGWELSPLPSTRASYLLLLKAPSPQHTPFLAPVAWLMSGVLGKCIG